MALDLAHRHAAGIEAQNLIVEPVKAGLALSDKFRFERTAPVAGDRDLHFPVLSQKRFRTRTIAAIAAASAGRIALLIAQMLRELRAKRPLDQCLLELLEEPIFARQILGPGIIRQKLVQQFR